MFYNEYCNCSQCIKYFKKEQTKMTREEALNKLKNIKTPLSVENIVDILEEVGLLEFEEEKEIVRLCSYDRSDLGVISVEEWPEGLVLWVGGEIKWKSWIQYWRKGDGVMIEYYDGLMDEKKKQTGIII